MHEAPGVFCFALVIAHLDLLAETICRPVRKTVCPRDAFCLDEIPKRRQLELYSPRICNFLK